MAIVSILVSLGGFAAGFLLGFPLSYLAGPFIGFAAGAAGFVLGIIARTGQRTAVSFAAFAIVSCGWSPLWHALAGSPECLRI